MVLNEEKRARLADALTRCQGALSGVGVSAPSAPIVAVPLDVVQALPAPTPLRRTKGSWRLTLGTRTLQRASSSKGEGWSRRRPLTPPPVVVPPHSRINLPVPLPPADFSHSRVVGRAPLGMTKLHMPPRYPLSFNTSSKASKKKGQ